jgi:hypothetical protein
MSGDPEAASEQKREELLDKYRELHSHAVDLRKRVKAQKGNNSGAKWGRTGLLAVAAIGGAAVMWIFFGGVMWPVVGFVGGFVVVVAVLMKLNPPHGSDVMGTRSWEAKLTLDPLGKCLADRRLTRSHEKDVGKGAHLDREIAFLEKQQAELARVAASGDRSPGRGYIGFDQYRE